MQLQEQNTAEKLDQLGKHILILSRNALYIKMRFLDVALSSYPFVMDMQTNVLGTDGLMLYFQPNTLGGLFRERPVLVHRLYLHLVLHGIFHHTIRKNGREKRLYHLACDIVTESIIDDMSFHLLKAPMSWLRKDTYHSLRKSMKILTAEKVYAELLKRNLTDLQLGRLEAEFRVDDHQYWPADEDQKKKQEIEKKWKDMSEQMQTDMETFSKETAASSGHFIDQLKIENRERMDYRQFLRKFAVLREETKADEDSFDYVFYSYGLRYYGNMPLIEPQEWRESMKVEEFAIVIDTSMSCSGELVRRFLRETYSILSETESFFQKVNIHIIQCDDCVQTDEVICCEDDLKSYMEHLDLHGEGGTDFRPAFAYVEELKQQGRFEHLKGLLYFTDGQGIYPAKVPSFETAFVFIKEDYEDAQVPPWAMKLILEEEDEY